MAKEEKSFFDELGDLCKRRLLPEAKRAWHELKKGAGDVKNVVATKRGQIQPRVREMKTKLTDAWERNEKKDKAANAIHKAAETSEEWAKRSMEKVEEKAKQWQPHVESAGKKIKSKLSRSKKDEDDGGGDT